MKWRKANLTSWQDYLQQRQQLLILFCFFFSPYASPNGLDYSNSAGRNSKIYMHYGPRALQMSRSPNDGVIYHCDKVSQNILAILFVIRIGKKKPHFLRLN